MNESASESIRIDVRITISCAINMAEPSNFAPDWATMIMALNGYSLGRSETLKKFHSHVLPLSGEKA